MLLGSTSSQEQALDHVSTTRNVLRFMEPASTPITRSCCLHGAWLVETALSPQQPALERPARLIFANRKEFPAQLCLDTSSPDWSRRAVTAARPGGHLPDLPHQQWDEMTITLLKWPRKYCKKVAERTYEREDRDLDVMTLLLQP